MEHYDPKVVEEKWKKEWFSKNIYKTENTSKNPKKYVLTEFPYPSGEGLHVGHSFSMTGADVYARKKRMEGYNVLFPMGWDAFGLPTENYAIKTGIKPQVATARNTKMFKEQMQNLGFSFDWSREINTTDPNYYKWTQWIFTELFKHGLAYKKKMAINWCPKCRIGLANEEVINQKAEDVVVSSSPKNPKSEILSSKQARNSKKENTKQGIDSPVSNLEHSDLFGASNLEFRVSDDVYNNVCERCGTPVEKKELDQWLLKITAYADRLADDLDLVDFPESVKASQRNWIGRSAGAEIAFPLKREVRYEKLDNEVGSGKKESNIPPQFPASYFPSLPSITVFTTRPDTIFGATFLVISPEHPLVASLLNPKSETRSSKQARNSKIENDRSSFGFSASNLFGASDLGFRVSEIQKYVDSARAKSELERTELTREKTGAFTGLYAINPATKKQIPIWISDFVLSTYGTGAIMAVPAHDRRDNEFAKKYELAVVSVIDPVSTVEAASQAARGRAKSTPLHIVNTEYGILTNSGNFTGMTSEKAIPAICNWLKEQGVGEAATTYHLRDWIFSRQHYWGEPIPMIYCEKCGWVAVPEKDLPVKLPNIEKYQPTGTGESPLASIKLFVDTKCPHCGGSARRETDTMPNWAGSSWYYLAYCLVNTSKNSKFEARSSKQARNPKSEKNSSGLEFRASNLFGTSDFEFSVSQNIFSASSDILSRWLPVDTYFGGDEHTTLHLLYSRFWHKFLYDMKLVSTPEPYQKRIVHGVILGPDGARMSKSKGNVINPDEVIKAYSADILRLYFLFMGPFEGTMAWDNKGVEGVARFLNRVWKLVNGNAPVETGYIPSLPIRRKLHQTIKKVGNDIDSFHYNTAIASMMEFINVWSDSKESLSKEDLISFIRILAPFAPFMSEEIYSSLRGPSLPGNTNSRIRGTDLKEGDSIHLSEWPKFDSELVKEDELTIAVQINGKLRSTFKISAEKATDEQAVTILAKELPEIAPRLVGQEVVKIIFVTGKLVNIVVK